MDPEPITQTLSQTLCAMKRSDMARILNGGKHPEAVLLSIMEICWNSDDSCVLQLDTPDNVDQALGSWQSENRTQELPQAVMLSNASQNYPEQLTIGGTTYRQEAVVVQRNRNFFPSVRAENGGFARIHNLLTADGGFTSWSQVHYVRKLMNVRA